MSNILGIIRELGMRYGPRVDAWWFDSCGSLDPNDWHHDFHHPVTTDMRGFKVDWDEWVKTAKAGFEGRLVTLNPGMLYRFVYSTLQDYEAGEANQPVAVPSTQFTQDNLQGHRWVCLDNQAWVHSRVVTPLAGPLYHHEYIEEYIRACNRVRVPVTFNVDIDRTGVLSPESLALLRDVKKKLV